jgi:hypothetical protein
MNRADQIRKLRARVAAYKVVKASLNVHVCTDEEWEADYTERVAICAEADALDIWAEGFMKPMIRHRVDIAEWDIIDALEEMEEAKRVSDDAARPYMLLNTAKIIAESQGKIITEAEVAAAGEAEAAYFAAWRAWRVKADAYQKTLAALRLARD